MIFGGFFVDTSIISVGRENFIPRSRIIAFLFPDSSPVKKMISDLRENNRVIDATRGRKTRSVIFLDNGFVLLSSVKTSTLANNYDILPGGKKNE
jgi:regulator of extracellular matrix RemA (YlzA/DUF370 family)